MNIGIWGHYHGGNLGDDIVVATVLHNIKIRQPDANVYGFSMDPRDTARRHRIPSYSIRLGLRKPFVPPEEDNEPQSGGFDGVKVAVTRKGSRLIWGLSRRLRRVVAVPFSWVYMWNATRRMDAIVVAGSQVLLDDWGAWEHPYRVAKWAFLCRLAGTKMILLNVGVGPLRRPLSRLFARIALRLADYRSFRDSSSIREVRMLGITGADFFPDLAFGLQGSLMDLARRPGSHGGRPQIGLSAMAHNDPRYWPDGNADEYHRYMQNMREFAHWLMVNGYDIILIKSQTRADARAAEEFIDDLAADHPDFVAERCNNPDTRGFADLLAQIAACRIVVGVRFHMHILPFVLGIPVLGIAYHNKSQDAMLYMGQGRYSIPISELSVTELVNKFQELIATHDQTAETINRKAAELRGLLSRQYDAIFGAQPSAQGFK